MAQDLHRFVLALHFSGQVTCERIVALLNGMGVLISKRQVVRLLTAKLETFPRRRRSGVESRSWRRLCDGRRHRGAPRRQRFTTQIGSDTFTVFRTDPSKSRLAFLSRLCGGTIRFM